MADSGIKKVTVLRGDLPAIGPNNNFIVRYRIVSEDKNRFSHWSPQYDINNIDLETIDGDVVLNGNTILVTWEDEVGRPSYDIFVKFDTDPNLYYHGTSQVHSYSLLKKAGASTVRIVVQPKGVKKIYSSSLVLYDSGNKSLI